MEFRGLSAVGSEVCHRLRRSENDGRGNGTLLAVQHFRTLGGKRCPFWSQQPFFRREQWHTGKPYVGKKSRPFPPWRA